jgi:hypothetical protein
MFASVNCLKNKKKIHEPTGEPVLSLVPRPRFAHHHTCATARERARTLDSPARGATGLDPPLGRASGLDPPPETVASLDPSLKREAGLDSPDP